MVKYAITLTSKIVSRCVVGIWITIMSRQNYVWNYIWICNVIIDVASVVPVFTWKLVSETLKQVSRNSWHNGNQEFRTILTFTSRQLTAWSQNSYTHKFAFPIDFQIARTKDYANNFSGNYLCSGSSLGGGGAAKVPCRCPPPPPITQIINNLRETRTTRHTKRNFWGFTIVIERVTDRTKCLGNCFSESSYFRFWISPISDLFSLKVTVSVPR